MSTNEPGPGDASDNPTSAAASGPGSTEGPPPSSPPALTPSAIQPTRVSPAQSSWPGLQPTGGGLGQQPVFPEGDIDPRLQTYIDLATTDLAERAGVDVAAIVVVSAVSVTWGDGSMGCPQPGVAYTQALQDGTVVELRANDRLYRYHSGGSKKPFLCDQPLKSTPRRIN